MKKILILIIVLTEFVSCQSQEKKNTMTRDHKTTDAEWKKILSPEQYTVLRNKGTEKPFTGAYWNTFEKGTYVCAACDNPIFTSDAKFNSDCGWPSFDQAIQGSVVYEKDHSFGMERIEVLCAKCGGHLGHIFDDGPQETTGKRFCANSVALKFIKK